MALTIANPKPFPSLFLDEDFEKRKMDEVNSRVDKQKAYVKNFVADLAEKMNRYIDSGKDIN